MRKLPHRHFVAASFAAIALALPAAAQLLKNPGLIQSISGGPSGAPQSEPAAPWPARTAGKLTVSPAAIEKPALRWTLLPKVEDTQKGNAATRYLAAIGDASTSMSLSMPENDLMDAAWDADLAKLDEKDPRLTALLEKFGNYRFLYEGARLDSADWETNIRQGGMMALVPSLGPLRQIINGLSIQIRIDIKHHDWAAAQYKLQTGYRLAQHLGMGETLIESLVGVAIASRMTRCLEDWVNEPGSPNLYWPLANLPSPFNDLRRPMSFEHADIWFTLPEFKEMRNGQFSADQWPRMLTRISQFTQVFGINGGEYPGYQAEVKVPEVKAKFGAAVFGMALYPQAKAFLIERGMSREAVDKMPVPEAIGRYFASSYEEESDELFKWTGLPAAEAAAGMKEWEKQFDADRQAGKVNILAAVLLPSLSNAIRINTRLDRQIAALRIVEALRSYAAEKGEFPPGLDALSVPLPVDPLGKPFEYQRTAAGTAIVASPPQEPARYGVRFELTPRK